MWFKTFIQTLVLLIMMFMGISIYCYLTNPGKSIFTCLRNIFSFRDPSDDGGLPEFGGPAPDEEEVPDAENRFCQFENEDIINKAVYTQSGNIISEQPVNLKCSECTTFINKDIDTGECYQYTFDPEYNAFDQTEATRDPDDPEPMYVCTAKLFGKVPCPGSKTPRQMQ